MTHPKMGVMGKREPAWICGVVLALLLPACGASFVRVDSETAQYVKALAAMDGDVNLVTQYRVGPEDVLDVRVWGDEGLSTRVAVRPDGIITLPLVGDVAVAGKSSVEIAREVESRLKKYKTTPKVDVAIAEINSYRIYLLGEVNQPGMIQVRNFTTLLQAISMAGGKSPFASNDILVLRRERGTGTERVLHIDYRLLTSQRADHRPYNLVLWPGDTVIVK